MMDWDRSMQNRKMYLSFLTQYLLLEQVMLVPLGTRLSKCKSVAHL